MGGWSRLFRRTIAPGLSITRLRKWRRSFSRIVLEIPPERGHGDCVVWWTWRRRADGAAEPAGTSAFFITISTPTRKTFARHWFAQSFPVPLPAVPVCHAYSHTNPCRRRSFLGPFSIHLPTTSLHVQRRSSRYRKRNAFVGFCFPQRRV